MIYLKKCFNIMLAHLQDMFAFKFCVHFSRKSKILLFPTYIIKDLCLSKYQNKLYEYVLKDAQGQQLPF